MEPQADQCLELQKSLVKIQIWRKVLGKGRDLADDSDLGLGAGLIVGLDVGQAEDLSVI